MAGALPNELPFAFAASVDVHYTQQGSFWPVGGASEVGISTGVPLVVKQEHYIKA